jgi:hypothetical protein
MWSARWQGFFGLGVLFVGAAVSAGALGYGPGDNRSPAVQTLVGCLERMFPRVRIYLLTGGVPRSGSSPNVEAKGMRYQSSAK